MSIHSRYICVRQKFCHSIEVSSCARVHGAGVTSVNLSRAVERISYVYCLMAVERRSTSQVKKTFHVQIYSQLTAVTGYDVITVQHVTKWRTEFENCRTYFHYHHHHHHHSSHHSSSTTHVKTVRAEELILGPSSNSFVQAVAR